MTTGIPAAAVRAYLDELDLPRHDVQLDRARLGRLAIDAIAAMSDEELAAAVGAPRRVCPRSAARERWSRRARTRGRSRHPRPSRSAARRTDDGAFLGAARRRRATRSTRRSARAILRELKAVGGDLKALRLALTGAERGPELWTWSPRSRARRGRARLGADAAVGIARRRSSTAGADTIGVDAAPGHAHPQLVELPAAARADRDVRLRADRLPARPHRERAAVRHLHVARALAPRAWARGDARPQHHRRQRQDLRGGAGRQRRARARGYGVVPRGHGRLRSGRCRRTTRWPPRRSPRSSR